QLPQVAVGMTVTTTDDRLSRFLEVRAPLASRRLKTLQQLHAAGLPTYAFVGPLLPHFRYQPALLDALFASLAAVGVQSGYVEHLNLKPYIKKRLWETVQHASSEVQAVYSGASTAVHRQALHDMVMELVEKYRLSLNLAEVLYHPQEQGSAPE